MSFTERIKAAKAKGDALVSSLVSLFADLEAFDAALQKLAGGALPPPPPESSGPGEPTSPTDGPGIFALYQAAAAGTGIHPVIGFAIWRHETGTGKSRLWREAFNPGGIKDTTLFGYGTYVADPTQEEGVVTYERFPSMRVGVAAHLGVLLKSRYQPAWNQPIDAQAEAIARAGYVAGSEAKVQDWIDGVRKFAHQAEAGVFA